jgi:2,4-dienoyl-CoA reductase-like NADH-dependent reductase (Old Yellow Enzyme family)
VTTARATSFVDLGSSLRLPCGAVLPNRIAKAAMTEQLADRSGRPTDSLQRLYARWARGGAGLLITGNVVVDPEHLGESYNVVVQDGCDVAALSRWADAAQSHGAHVWMQLNHPGRQAMRLLGRRTVAPSAVRFSSAVHRATFAPPRELTAEEISDLVERFGRAAAIAEAAGFDGVEVHAAHGYLVSQFLSPLTNRRTDAWGGDADRRMRFLLEVIRSIRSRVGSPFAVGVKLNSADFQRGGFTLEDSMRVVEALNDERIDLLEITGGTAEAPEVVGELKRRESTTDREAFFADYARSVRRVAKMPLMLSGGIRSPGVMRSLVAEGHVDVVGIARKMTLFPDLPAHALRGDDLDTSVKRQRTGVRLADLLLDGAWHVQQIHRMAAGLAPDPRRGLVRTSLAYANLALRWRLGRSQARRGLCDEAQ